MFGSHEAHWAAHFEAYSSSSLSVMLETFGFGTISIKHTSWRDTHNIEIIAQKKKSLTEQQSCQQAAREYLRNFLLDDSTEETSLLEIWMNMFNVQLAKNIITN